jgi:glycosyltransferase involved in cell wall biosynthesis
VDIHTQARVYFLQPTGFNKALWDSLYDDPVILDPFLDRDLWSVLWNTWLQVEGAAIVEREQPDFLYERYALFGYGGLELARRFNLPLILELNAPLCDQQAGYQKFPLIHAARLLERQIIMAADGIVALTQWLADWAVDLGADREKIRIIPDAVSHRLFASPIDGSQIRKELALEGRPVVGFVGSFHKWHDVSGLIDAFGTLYKSDSKLRLLLVGDGHDRAKLQKQVQQRGLAECVVFTDKVPHEQIPQYIAAMDVAVVPYQPIADFFFSPMKLFECMAAGRPTVAARLGQIAHIVRHGETGWLYEAGDNVQLAQGIGTLLSNRTRAAQIGAAARAYVLKHHTWEQVTREVVTIAAGLMGTRRSTPDAATAVDP